MKEEYYQELLNRAVSLMDERDADISLSAMHGPLSVRGRTLSLSEDAPRAAAEEGTPRTYPGDLQLLASRVRVIPFGVYNGSLDYFMVPNIEGRSLFADNPPTLSRTPGGAAVYIESEFELYHRGTPSAGVGDNPYLARLVACNIVSRDLGEPYPIEKAVLSVSVPSGTWALDNATAKAYRLLGVYNSAGTVYNQTYIGGEPWYYEEFTFDGRVLPPSRPAAMQAPIKYEVTFD